MAIERRHFKSFLAKGKELELVKLKTDLRFSSQRGKSSYLGDLKKKYERIKKDYNKLREELALDGERKLPRKWLELEHEHNGTVNSLEELRSISGREGNEEDTMTAINILRWLVRTEAKGNTLRGLVQADQEQKEAFNGVENLKHLRETGKLGETGKSAGIKKQDMQEFSRLVNKLIGEHETHSYKYEKDKFILKESFYRHELEHAIKETAKEEGWDLEKKETNLAVIKSRKSAFDELKRTMENMTEEQKSHVVDFMISTGMTKEGNAFVKSL